MSKQSYHSHVRLHPVYHFFLLPVAFIFFGLSIYFSIQKIVQQGQWLEGIYYLTGSLVVASVVALLRLYPLQLQDRIIRSEVKMRYFSTTGHHLNGMEKNLRTSQLIALRFASDEELSRLVEQTIQENLPAAEIKKRIRKWRSDHHRI